MSEYVWTTVSSTLSWRCRDLKRKGNGNCLDIQSKCVWILIEVVPKWLLAQMVQPYLCLITLKWMSFRFPSGPLYHHWKSSEGFEHHSFKLESVETAVSNLCSVVPRETEAALPGINSRQRLATCQLSCSFVYWLTLSPHPPQFDPHWLSGCCKWEFVNILFLTWLPSHLFQRWTLKRRISGHAWDNWLLFLWGIKKMKTAPRVKEWH